MRHRLGPILHARSQTDPGRWRFSVCLVVSRDGPSLEVQLAFDQAEVQVTGPVEVANFPDLGALACTVLRWEVDAPRAHHESRLSYQLSSAAAGWPSLAFGDVRVPAVGSLPRLAFFSCNGCTSGPEWKELDDPYLHWRSMLAEQTAPAEPGFHLLVGGGDQVYADALWEVPGSELDAFARWPRRKMRTAVPTPGFGRRMLADYLGLYFHRWGAGSGIDELQARVPGLYTWDDHDVFDGWGSHGELNDCPYFRAIFEAAAQAFQAIQRGGEPPSDGHFLRTARFTGGGAQLDVVLLDLRSGRTDTRVMSDAQWRDLDAWRRAQVPLPGGARHVLVVSSLPLVFLRFPAALEPLAGLVQLKDDLRDQWESPAHRGERARLVMNLFGLGRQARCAVTVLSGDLHLGSRGRLRSRNPAHLWPGQTEAVIEQLTSSGIVHPPPGALAFAGLRTLAFEGPEDLDAGLTTELVPLGRSTYLADRNWLAVRFDDAGTERRRLWAQWRPERSELPTQVVVEAP